MSAFSGSQALLSCLRVWVGEADDTKGNMCDAGEFIFVRNVQSVKQAGVNSAKGWTELCFCWSK